MLPFLSEGDEVLIQDPSYPSNFLNANLCGAKAVHVPLYPENGYQIDIQEFEKRVTKNTKMVVITHPNNPTGTVFNKKSLTDLCDFIKKYDLVLVDVYKRKPPTHIFATNKQISFIKQIFLPIL